MKAILVFRDRPRLPFDTLERQGFVVHWASTIREARDQFDTLDHLDAVVVNVENGVERALEFCDIVHVTRPNLPILFVRSSHRPSVEPLCAHRVLEPEASEAVLTDEVLLLFQSAPAPPDRRTA